MVYENSEKVKRIVVLNLAALALDKSGIGLYTFCYPVTVSQEMRNMPTIRIDDEVYAWLKSKAIPFEDTPNSVLRRLAGLEKPRDMGFNAEISEDAKEENQMNRVGNNPGRARRLDGKYFRELWKVNVDQALYHHDGTWYENLQHFPGALFDINGYVIFRTEEEYNDCTYLHIGQQLNVPNGISSIPRYKRMR
jgi:hypothetical protein